MPHDLIIHGAAGRMGRRLIALALEAPHDWTLTAALDTPHHPLLGQDSGLLASTRPSGIPLSSALESRSDVLIDFSLPDALPALLEAAVRTQTPLVSGTTGLDEDLRQRLLAASSQIPILHSPNMSIGVNLVFLLAKQIAHALGEDADIEILEAHHNLKKDAPSGTALRLAEMAAEGRSLALQDVARYSRHGILPSRPRHEIGIQTLRGGDIVGEHTAYFCMQGERIELTHRATSRDIFARGALRAARWLLGRSPGLYSIQDTLSSP